jgi:hypothetical protein
LTSAKPSIRHVEREDVLLWLFVVTPIAAWIAAQQLSYLATRSLCASGHRWVLFLVMVPALAAAAAAGAASWMKWQGLASKHSTDVIPAYRRFMALGGVLMSAICSVSILALMIPAAIHRLCD